MGQPLRKSKITLRTFAPAIVCAAMEISTLFLSPAALAADPENSACEQCVTARSGIKLLMNGDPNQAIKVFKDIELKAPESPLGYLLDADANWWKIYFTTANLVDPDVFDVVRSKTSPYDSHFQDLVAVAIQKSEARTKAGQDVARSQLYEGMAYALRARYFGLRDNDLPTARAAKKMRTLLLAAAQADPKLIDPDAGLGLYNYFVDTLPGIVKMLKFLVGLPGGSRELGLQQLQRAAEHGDFVRAEAKFYLAKDYSRWNEKQYAKSLELFRELAREYPANPLWKLLVGSLEIRLGRGPEGEALYRAVLENTAREKTENQKAFHHAAQEALARLHPEQKN